MIRIKIDILEKEGKVSVESYVGACKETPTTEAEQKMAGELRGVIELAMKEFSTMIPGSKIATSQEDIETLKGMENLNLEKGADDVK